MIATVCNFNVELREVPRGYLNSARLRLRNTKMRGRLLLHAGDALVPSTLGVVGSGKADNITL